MSEFPPPMIYAEDEATTEEFLQEKFPETLQRFTREELFPIVYGVIHRVYPDYKNFTHKELLHLLEKEISWALEPAYVE